MVIFLGILIGLMFGVAIGAWIQDKQWRKYGDTGKLTFRGKGENGIWYKVHKFAIHPSWFKEKLYK